MHPGSHRRIGRTGTTGRDSVSTIGGGKRAKENMAGGKGTGSGVGWMERWLLGWACETLWRFLPGRRADGDTVSAWQANRSAWRAGGQLSCHHDCLGDTLQSRAK